MPSPNSNSAEMNSWLAQANAAGLGDASCEFGNFGADTDDDSDTNDAGSLDSDD